jgi:hypothetical protein
MTTTDTKYTKFDKFDIGCYLDGARGVYIGEAIQADALLHGWRNNGWGAIHVDHAHPSHIPYPCPCPGEDDHGQWYHEATTEAEDYLNTLTDDDVAFGPSESGDWGLWHICDDDTDCEFCESL